MVKCKLEIGTVNNNTAVSEKRYKSLKGYHVNTLHFLLQNVIVSQNVTNLVVVYS